MQAQALDGKPIVTLVNFQCHGTVLGPKNLLVSADWIGAMRRNVEQVSGAPLMYLQGATGDLNPDHEWGEDDFSALESIGLRIADRSRAGPSSPGIPFQVSRSAFTRNKSGFLWRQRRRA